MEKTRRRKMWYKGDEEVCWESWTIRVTVAEPRTENGEPSYNLHTCAHPTYLWQRKEEGFLTQNSKRTERAKVRKAMETTLLTTVMKIITSVNSFKDHIPPITTTETNPFPYNITVNQKDAVGGAAAAATGGGGWGSRFGGLY
jgi:hypothetical protein